MDQLLNYIITSGAGCEITEEHVRAAEHLSDRLALMESLLGTDRAFLRGDQKYPVTREEWLETGKRVHGLCKQAAEAYAKMPEQHVPCVKVFLGLLGNDPVRLDKALAACTDVALYGENRKLAEFFARLWHEYMEERRNPNAEQKWTAISLAAWQQLPVRVESILEALRRDA